MSGIRSVDLPTITTFSDVIAHLNSGVGLLSSTALSTQLLATGPLADAIAALEVAPQDRLLKGLWDASSGTFPTSTSTGEYWVVSTAGTTDGVAFAVRDEVVALVDNASTSTYAANWLNIGSGLAAKADQTALDTHTANETDPHGGTAAGMTLFKAADVAAQKAALGLDAVDNTSDADKPISTATQNALAAKAPVNNAALTGSPTAPTPDSGSDGTQIATTEWVRANGGGGASSDYLPAPNYSNPGGQGDRTASIVVTIDDTLITSGKPGNLVDSGSANNAADSITYAALAAAGLVVARFDYGIGKRKIITEATWTQSATSTHATVKWQGSNDLVNWTDIGSSFVLGGATSQAQTELSANRDGYRAYQIIGVSGSMSAAPYIHEVTFKIADDFADDVVPGLATVFHDRKGAAPTFAADMVAAYLPALDHDGATCYDRWGAYNVDLSAPTSQTYERTAHGVKLASGLFETPEIAGAREVCVFYRSKQDESAGFIISGGSSSGSGVLEESVATSETTRVAGFGHAWKEVNARSDTGGGARELNRGVWAFVSRDMGAAHDTILGIGGRHSTTTSRCAEIEIVAVFVFNATLTTAKREELLLFMRGYAAGLGIYFINGDGPKECVSLSIWGDSLSDGRAQYVSWPSTIADSDLHYSPFLQIMAGGDGDDFQYFAPLVPKVNAKLDSVITNGGKEESAGLELAMARHIGNNLQDFHHPVFCDKFGKGGSDLSSSATGSATNGLDSWSPSELETSSLYYDMMAHHRRAMGLLMADGYSVKNWVVVIYLGTNDMTTTDSAADAAAAEALVDALLDAVIADCPSIAPKFIWLQPGTELASEAGIDSTAVTRIRAGIANAGTARSDLTVVDTSGDGKNGDGIHFSGAAYVSHATSVAALITA